MRASQAVPSSPLTPVPDLDDSDSEGDLGSELSATDSEEDLSGKQHLPCHDCY